jgi:hypothetical protein
LDSQLIEKPQLFGFQEERDLVHGRKVGLENFCRPFWRYIRLALSIAVVRSVLMFVHFFDIGRSGALKFKVYKAVNSAGSEGCKYAILPWHIF